LLIDTPIYIRHACEDVLEFEESSMTCSLLFAVLATGLVFDQAAAPPAQGQTETAGRLSSAEISQLRVKAETGDAAAQHALGRAYGEGKGVPQSDEEAVKWYRKAAEQGYAAAQNDLGLMYLTESGVEEHKEEAVKWYQKAARQKYPAALFNLGTAYYNGDGVAVDVVSAFAWFVLAEEAGSKPAVGAVKRMRADLPPFNASDVFEKIAEMYEKGIDLPQNNGEAVKWCRKAAESDGAPVRVKLAGLLLQGQDYDEARRLCEEAAKQRYSPGAYCVGLVYERGLGVSQNPIEAVKWFKRAAEMGHAVAMLRVGEMYRKGSGVKPDRISAYAFIFLASSADIPEAKQERVSLEREMGSKDVEKAKKKAIEWAKQHQHEWPHDHPLVPRRKANP